MTGSEIEQAVCRATGESRRIVRTYGFSLLPDEPESVSDPLILVDCPGCGTQLDAARKGTDGLVECPRCDAVYPFAVEEMYVADAAKQTLAACA